MAGNSEALPDAQGLNLAPHRASASVWSRRGWARSSMGRIVVRWVAAVGGGLVLLEGLRRDSPGGAVLAGLGGGLACWALADAADVGRVRRQARQLAERVTRLPPDDADVQQASAESFPASDAPSWTPTVGTGLRRRGPWR